MVFVGISMSAQNFVHPGLSHKKSDLERMKHMAKTGMEPWGSSFALLQADAFSSYNYVVQGNTSMTELSNFALFRNDGYAAYHNALMWYITEDVRHAEKCVEIFNAWVNLKRVGSTLPLESGRVIWKFLEGAEIIKHTYSGWANSDIQKLEDMLVYPGYSSTTEPTSAIASNDVTFYWSMYNGDSARHGNQGLFAFRGVMAMGIFMDNELMYQRALRYLQGLPHLSEDLPYHPGPPINSGPNATSNEYYLEYSRNGHQNTIQDYGYNEVIANNIWENGQNQESSRDQSHALLGPSIINTICEMAWNQGDDIYSHLDNRLLLGYEHYFRYNLSLNHSFPDQTTPWEPTAENGEFIQRRDRSGRWHSLKINPWTGSDLTRLSRGGKNLAPVYEISLAHYKNRMNVETSKTKWLERGFALLEQGIGVENGSDPSDHPGYGGLKFRRVSPGDPISGFDSNGLPVFKIHDTSNIIEAENFDYFTTNGQGKTYNDLSSSNVIGEYRSDEDVDIKTCSEGGYAVTNIQNGEWLIYTLNVSTGGLYDISIRYASVNANGKIRINVSGDDLTSEVSVPFGGSNSTGLTDWKDLKVANSVRLSKGVYPMKIIFSGEDNSFDLNNIVLSLVEADPEPTNVAVDGVATQSSYRDRGHARNAIDGNRDGDHSLTESVTHTNNDLNAWWQVDLGKDKTISEISIFNRTDCCSDRLKNFTVYIIDSQGNITYSKIIDSYPNPSISLNTGNKVGQVVKIQLNGSGFLSLAEVEVYAKEELLSTLEIKANNVRIFPNPVDDNFIISNSKGSKIEIYDMLGKLSVKYSIESNNQSININNFKKGVYFVKVKSTKGTSFVKKIIKR
ncbi:T9SS type A sorting domain-containing protein [Mariniflexile gromovii]|uniref:T9SS type A sorting domain-containing protein n=1 Tax=Mariniflexile gromovii TaxID=362523 RepID=A0ABS4BTA8_9FLAO|nr:T9SS type A sorting domain-containing protein [Mariniflexile gromovii]MBP0903827.1 T9SS type A sorting domain-containing protein [Mariniflexile gromovii]